MDLRKYCFNKSMAIPIALIKRQLDDLSAKVVYSQGEFDGFKVYANRRMDSIEWSVEGLREDMKKMVTRDEFKAEMDKVHAEIANLTTIVVDLTNSCATREELEGLATKDELHEAVAGLATKEELREAVEGLATKDDLRETVAGLATKDELHEAVADLATKEELHDAVAGLATKEEVKTLSDQIAILIQEVALLRKERR